MEINHLKNVSDVIKTELPLMEEGTAKVTFSWKKDVNSSKINSILYQKQTSYNSTEQELTRLYNNNIPNTEEAITTKSGLEFSSIPIQEYQMTIDLEGAASEFFNKKQFISSELFAKNSTICHGGLTSSFNRRADRVTMMRQVRAEDGSSDYYTGRVDTKEKAIEQAKFLFLSEFVGSRKGITEKEDGTYEFCFSAQSLLSMGKIEKTETTMFFEAKKTYNSLKNTTISVPLDVTNPSKMIQVTLHPISLAGTPYNWSNKVAKVVSDFISGQIESQSACKEADQELEIYYTSHKETFDEITQKHIEDTLYFLSKGISKEWQQVMYRAYLCHLLKIPQVLHCKSSVDRTNLAGAMIVAMKQWLRAECGVPMTDGGHYNIAKIIDQPFKGDSPFKELFAYNLHKGLKSTELSRGEKGFKWNTEKANGDPTSLSLLDLLPDRYLIKNAELPRQLKIAAVRFLALPIFATLALIGALMIGPFYRPKDWTYKKLCKSLAVSVVKAFLNADTLFNRYKINYDYENVGKRQLVIG